MTSFLSLPSDIIIDGIIPLLSAKEFLNLSATCKALHVFSTDEVYWHKLTTSIFRLPAQPIREKGWKQLYKNLSRATIFTWGSNDKSRLGHSQEQPNVYEPTKIPNVKNEVVVDITAGGWSTTVLTASGSVLCWGALGMSHFHRHDLQYIHHKLSFPRSFAKTKIVQLSSGRSHILGLSDEGRIWQWTNKMEPAKFFKFINFDTKLYETRFTSGKDHETVGKVVAGWNHSVALVNGVGLVIWWDLDNRDSSDDGFLVHGEVVPDTSYIGAGKFGKSGDSASAKKVGEVTDFMAGSSFVVFITKDGKVFGVDTTDPKTVALGPVQLPAFSAPPGESPMSYISGSFQTFAVFNKDGRVYIGTSELVQRAIAAAVAGITLGEPVGPVIIPSLQKRGIVAVAFGDYHSLALTSEGKVLSWGTEPRGCGCLGLGPKDTAIQRGVDYTFRDGQLDVPTEVPFPTGSTNSIPSESGASRESTFIFNIAAAGWHSGALALAPNLGKKSVPNERSTAISVPKPPEDFRTPQLMPHYHWRPIEEAGHGGRVRPGEEQAPAGSSGTSSENVIVQPQVSPFIRHGPVLRLAGSRLWSAMTGGSLRLGPNDHLSSPNEEARRQARLQNERSSEEENGNSSQGPSASQGDGDSGTNQNQSKSKGAKG